MCTVLLPPVVNPTAVNSIPISISKASSYLRRVCLSPHIITRLPQDEFSSNLILINLKSLDKIQMCRNVTKITEAVNIFVSNTRTSTSAVRERTDFRISVQKLNNSIFF
jgi:hypothetical protein